MPGCRVNHWQCQDWAPLTSLMAKTNSYTMSWLDQVEVVADRSNQTPLEVGMAKLKGAPLWNTHKTHDLIWSHLRKLLIENYLDTPYISIAKVVYNKISQAENEFVSQYLMHTKDYLEHINHASKLSSMDSSGLYHISLVHVLSDSYVRRRASKGIKLEDNGWCFQLHHQGSKDGRKNKSIQWAKVWDIHWHKHYFATY